jgi:hypothetical protein
MLCVGQQTGTYLNAFIVVLLHEFYGVQFWFLILSGENVMPIPTLYFIPHHVGNFNARETLGLDPVALLEK